MQTFTKEHTLMDIVMSLSLQRSSKRNTARKENKKGRYGIKPTYKATKESFLLSNACGMNSI